MSEGLRSTNKEGSEMCLDGAGSNVTNRGSRRRGGMRRRRSVEEGELMERGFESRDTTEKRLKEEEGLVLLLLVLWGLSLVFGVEVMGMEGGR